MPTGGLRGQGGPRSGVRGARVTRGVKRTLQGAGDGPKPRLTWLRRRPALVGFPWCAA